MIASLHILLHLFWTFVSDPVQCSVPIAYVHAMFQIKSKIIWFILLCQLTPTILIYLDRNCSEELQQLHNTQSFYIHLPLKNFFDSCRLTLMADTLIPESKYGNP